MAVTQAQLTELYLAYFGRPPDFDGIQFYTSNPAATMTSVAAGFSASPESTALYGSVFGAAQVNAIYQNLFNRSAEPAGLAYWTAEVAAGRLTAAGAAQAILQGAQNTDKTTVTNKIALSTAFVAQLDTNAEIIGYSGTASAASARAFLATVTDTAASVTAANAALAGAVTNAVGLGSGNVGTTYTLAIAAETLVGTGANDTFNSADTTLTAADSIDGAVGSDTLNFTNATAAAAFPSASIKNVEIVNVRATANLNSSDLSTLLGLTNFNSDRSTAAAVTTTNAGSGVQYGLIGDGATLFGAAAAFGYAAGATVATVNLAGGVRSAAATTVTVTGAGVASTVINSTGAANSLSVAATAGAIVNAASSKSTTINASSNLTTALTTTADTALTVTGTGTVDLSGVNYGSALNNALVTISAAAMTAGGLKVQAGNSTTLKFTGGAGNDTLGLGAVLATGAVADAGAGTDTLYVAGNTAYITAATGAIIKNFEVVDVTTATVDLDNLATNNTLTGLRVGGSATVSNINAATAGNVTVYANATPVLNVKGATTPGQLDTVKIDVNDGAAAVNTITLTAPTLTAVETLQVTATDNVTITSLANALALTGITFTGAGNVALTTTAIALNPNVVVDASAATGNFTLDATGATANGYTIKGSAGTNILTGGSAPIAVDISKSVAKADQVIITSATGSTASVLQSITGFTNATTTGDKLDVINTGTITANAAAGTATGVTNLTAQITTGVITFGGTAAATATLQNKIDAAATLAGTTQYNMVAFEHSGNTYVYEQGDTTATYAAGVDLIVQLTGVTGVTALSTTASGATTVFVV